MGVRIGFRAESIPESLSSFMHAMNTDHVNHRTISGYEFFVMVSRRNCLRSRRKPFRIPILSNLW